MNSAVKHPAKRNRGLIPKFLKNISLSFSGVNLNQANKPANRMNLRSNVASAGFFIKTRNAFKIRLGKRNFL